MGGEQMACLTLAALCAAYGVYQLIRLLRSRGNTAGVQAVVMSVSTVMPERVRRNNSKWALVSYRVNGVTYSPGARIQVPMSAAAGSLVTVRYCLNDPGKVVTFSWARLVVAAAATAVLFAAGVACR